MNRVNPNIKPKGRRSLRRGSRLFRRVSLAGEGSERSRGLPQSGHPERRNPGVVENSGTDAEQGIRLARPIALWFHHDHDRSGFGWVAYQGYSNFMGSGFGIWMGRISRVFRKKKKNFRNFFRLDKRTKDFHGASLGSFLI